MPTEIYARERVDILIDSLNEHCFVSGAKKYASDRKIDIKNIDIVNFSQGELKEFNRYTNDAFKSAQRLIIDNRLLIEDPGTVIKAPYTKEYLIKLLTDYADLLGWTLLQHDISAVRNQFLDNKKPSPLRDQNWESIESSLEHFNEDPYSFALATDLTSFMQIGDLYCVNASEGYAKNIEVKTGKQNGVILDALQSKNAIEDIKNVIKDSSKPQKTASQVQRILRQQQRAITSSKYFASKGVFRHEIKDNARVDIHEDRGRSEEKWSKEVYRAIKDVKDDKTTYGSVNDCMFFVYRKKMYSQFEQFYFQMVLNDYLGLGLESKELEKIPIINISQIQPGVGAPPRSLSFMHHFGPEIQEGFMKAGSYLAVYLDIPRLQDFLSKQGFIFELKNSTAYEQKYNDGFTKHLFGQNKTAHISTTVDGKEHEWSLLSGTWVRVFFDFMSPQELINYSKFYMNNSAPKNNSKRNSKRKKRKKNKSR